MKRTPKQPVYSDSDSDNEMPSAPVASTAPVDTKLDNPMLRKKLTADDFHNVFQIDVPITPINALSEMDDLAPTNDAVYFNVGPALRQRVHDQLEHSGYTAEQIEACKSANNFLVVSAVVNERQNQHGKVLVLHSDHLVPKTTAGGVDVAPPNTYAYNLNKDIHTPLKGGMTADEYELLKRFSPDSINNAIAIQKNSEYGSWARLHKKHDLFKLLEAALPALPEKTRKDIDLHANKEYVELPVPVAEELKKTALAKASAAMAQTHSFDNFVFYITGAANPNDITQTKSLASASDHVGQTVGLNSNQLIAEPVKIKQAYGWNLTLGIRLVLP